VGSLATIATFSFYGNKVFTCGEGGALTLSDPDLESRARLLRGQGMDPNRRYYFPIVGHNFRLTNVACAMLCAQLERRHAIVGRRRQIQARYRAKLARSKVGLQPVADWAEESPWLFNVTIDEKAFGLSSAGVMNELAKRGIETRPFFIPIHTLPSFAAEHARGGQRLPVTELLAATGVSLPLYNGLTDEEVDEVVDTLLGLSG
jgi:perosamine synthetase